MSKFIELTQYDSYRGKESVFVPIDKIQLIKPSSRDGSTYVWVEGMKYEINVFESPQTIQRLIEAADDTKAV
jgi:DNA helicase HerA-like ATPase